MPLVLVALVIVAHQLSPDVSVPRIVVFAGLNVTVVGLLVSGWRRALRRLARHARHDLPMKRGEVTLFASAGVLAVGLQVLMPALNVELPVERFTVAWCAMLAMILLALVGVHPVVSVAIVAALVLPLNPEPTLFVLAASMGWGTATAAVGPITGLTKLMMGRYGVDGLVLTRWNLVYLGAVLGVAWPALHVGEWAVGMVGA
ncbi:hypothetical protein [Cryobacterium sp. CG_9.6]|uniref:hypothetical protein n=1 Tax=Cryobacterium sp. CG_9.6 TaxID=2760710 RepID=UPI0024739566|nr:hypothetical protein [Cryobacterium sp. CG_9.6]MDH6238136.1 hypothetical protein [Cryobacterium sp. CG_9.6]